MYFVKTLATGVSSPSGGRTVATSNPKSTLGIGSSPKQQANIQMKAVQLNKWMNRATCRLQCDREVCKLWCCNSSATAYSGAKPSLHQTLKPDETTRRYCGCPPLIPC